MTIPLNPEIMKSRIQKLKNECHGSVAGGKTHTRSQRSDKVLKDFKKWDGRKSIGSDNFHISFMTLFLTFVTSV